LKNKANLLFLKFFLTKGQRFFVPALDKVPDPVYTPGHATGNGADGTGNWCRRVISSVGRAADS
jgi:hypothetical protein